MSSKAKAGRQAWASRAKRWHTTYTRSRRKIADRVFVYNRSMDLQSQVAQNTRDNITNNNKRGATIARVCGEEHNAIASGGTATIFLTCDNDLCYISDYKFKLVFNGGSSGGWINAPIPTSWSKGPGLWSTFEDFKRAYPIGSALDTIEGNAGAQCTDYANAFWWGAVGRPVNCYGHAKTIFDGHAAENAGSEFDLITNWADLKPGDWLVWGGSQYGHVAVAVSRPSGDSITVWEQNGSTGAVYPAGGKCVGEATAKKANFLGAFRLKRWN